MNSNNGNPTWLFIGLFLYLCVVISPQLRFCSSYCRAQGCNGITKNDCNNRCNINWSPSVGTCEPNTFYRIVSTSIDIGGSATFSPTKPFYTCGVYSVYGLYSSSDVVTITVPTGIAAPYFQMTAYVWVIALDCFEMYNFGADSMFFTDGSTLRSIRVSSPTVRQFVCSLSNRRQSFFAFSISKNSNVTNSSLSWTVYTNSISPNATFGIKQFILIARICNATCLSCQGVLSSQCYSCVTPNMLSNSTCASSCLNQFGPTSDPKMCIYCNLRCSACYEVFDNCTICTAFGKWESFLSPNSSECISMCPPKYFANKSSHTCDQCNTNCTTCLFSTNYCTGCQSGFGWSQFICYSPCPIAFFLDNNGTNCTKCDRYCSICSGSPANCSVCIKSGVNEAYLQGNSTCLKNCLIGSYKQNFNNTGPNICLACPASCLYCTGNPTPCSACKTNFYLYQSSCNSDCPNGYFAYNLTSSCLNCSQSCVRLAIKMYFSDALSNKIYIDFQFSTAIDFTTFNMTDFQTISISSPSYSMSMFNLQYLILSPRTYRIVLQPKGYIFLRNVTFTVQTIAKPPSNLYSADLRPFDITVFQQTASLAWFLIKGPDLSDIEQSIILQFSVMSTRTNTFLSWPGLQEIKKSGLLTLFMSGAQITSSTILANSVPSQNLYEGTRFWASFVFFDAPNYQQNSQFSKNVIVPSVDDLVANSRLLEQSSQRQLSPERLLFQISEVSWRFRRTGQTSFYIYDVYMPSFLIVLCIFTLFLGRLFKTRSWFRAYMSAFYSFSHKIHQISIFYVTMAAVLQFMHFEATTFERVLSLGICCLFNLYLLSYQLYIYYDMINYPLAQIGSHKYEDYAMKYGSLLKNIRYQEYDIRQQWSPKHWIRPYNYHILSYYKKCLMIASLPLFYEIPHTQMLVLMALQSLQIARLTLTWPFQTKFRNIYRLALEIILLVFFGINYWQSFIVIDIMENNPQTIGKDVNYFIIVGWVGFLCCFLFNLGHIAIMFYDMYNGCRYRNIELMDRARKNYYFAKLSKFDTQGEAPPSALASQWVLKGNLNDHRHGELPNISVRLESYRIIPSQLNNSFSDIYTVEIKKLLCLQMSMNLNFRAKNNTQVGDKLQKRITLSESKSPAFYQLVNRLYKQYGSSKVENMTVKTFLKVEQRLYEAGDTIQFDRRLMFQKIQLQKYNGELQTIRIDKLMPGFPIGESLLRRA